MNPDMSNNISFLSITWSFTGNPRLNKGSDKLPGLARSKLAASPTSSKSEAVKVSESIVTNKFLTPSSALIVT